MLKKVTEPTDEVQTKHGMSYLEMKYNLLLMYCNLLNFYILLRLEGKPISNHPVLKRLIHFKLLLEKLRPLDQKMNYQVEKMMKLSVMGDIQADKLKFKPNMD